MRPLLLAGLVTLLACERPDLEHLPDELLRSELGLTDEDVVYTVTISGGDREVASPSIDTIPAGAWVQFVTGDWLVHEVAFEEDSLSSPALAFLARDGQIASPPLVELDARFVVSFEGAPPGRYPYLLQGNGAPGRGVLVVADPDAR